MLRQHPHELYLLALTEMSQRFAFFGIANLLVLYLTSLHLPSPLPEHLFGLLTGTAFIFPILGGYIADRFHYHLPIRLGICLSAMGCFLLSIPSMSVLYIALIFLALGCGVLMPSMYALLHTLYQSHPFREGGFSIYYSSVNIGALLALVTLGFLGHKGYWTLSFFIAGSVQLLGLIPLHYALNHPLLKTTCQGRSISPTPHLSHREKDQVLAILLLSLFSIFFWIGYNQGGSSLSLLALHNTDRWVGNFEVPAAWFFSSEVLYMVLFTLPLVAIYLFFKKKKIDVSPLGKYALGLLSLGICFIILYQGVATLHESDELHKMSPIYLLGAYAFMALAEILIFPIGIALITSMSPLKSAGFYVGIWYFCIGVAFYIGGYVAPSISVTEKAPSLLMFFSICSCGVFLLFCCMIPLLKRKCHLKSLR